MKLKKIIDKTKKLKNKEGKEYNPSYYVLTEEFNGKKLTLLINPICKDKNDFLKLDFMVSEVESRQ